MKFVQMPDTSVLNLDRVDMLVPLEDTGEVDVFVGGCPDPVRVSGKPAEMLRAWMAKRPPLVAPARGAKK